MFTSSVTQKGQVTIPKKIRNILSLQANDQVAFIRRGDHIIIKPLRSIFSLKGLVKSDKEMDSDQIRDRVKKDIAAKLGRE
ncbi:MAG: AbrB/MazE/SpoVT family DNA-binding domain-containing protein [Caldithrix sp.]|nr:AbrB/MazE/SpoVT family DNA-binding domain-containing protein [Caldithrix sp.]